MSKQAYYQHGNKQMQKLALESFVVEFVREVRTKDPGIGGNKLWWMYRNRFGEENSVGYNRFYDILDRYSLKVRKRRHRTRTTDSSHPFPVYPNLTKELLPDSPCQLMVSDITYIYLGMNERTGKNRFCYLSVVTDAYSKEIIGYSVGETLDARYPLEALDMAIAHYGEKDLSGLIHHSDRGVQYASSAYTGRLKDHKIGISMTECGNPKENAIAERVNNTLKNELLKDMEFHHISQVKSAVASAVEFYNHERPHWSLDGMTPSEAACHKGELKKRWKSYREEAIKRLSDMGMTG